MEPKKTYYYTDERKDDFAENGIHTKKIGDDFKYIHDSRLWKAASAFFYRGIATPVAWFTCRILYGAKLINKKALKAISHRGYFLYANHTQGAHDAFEPTLVTFPKKCYIVTSPDAVSMPGMCQLVQMLGSIPTPGTMKAAANFKYAIEKYISDGKAVTIYPEAHIWPYYAGVRNFPDDSFVYPVRLGAPVVAFAVKYRERKIFRKLPPLITVIISDPMYPDESLNPREARADLRNRVYDFLREKLCVPDNAEYIRYEKTIKPENNFH